jgi:hypothetical protein
MRTTQRVSISIDPIHPATIRKTDCSLGLVFSLGSSSSSNYAFSGASGFDIGHLNSFQSGGDMNSSTSNNHITYNNCTYHNHYYPPSPLWPPPPQPPPPPVSAQKFGSSNPVNLTAVSGPQNNTLVVIATAAITSAFVTTGLF